MKKIIFIFGTIFIPMLSFGQANVDEENIKNNFEIKPTALIHLDGAGYLEDKTRLSNGVTISDVRLGVAAGFGKWYGRVDMSYANNKVGFRDVTLTYNIKNNSKVVGGYFFEPMGLSRLQGTNFKFMTLSSSATAFTPGRSLGVAYSVWSNNIWFSAGIFGDKNLGPTTDNGDDGYAFTTRFVLNPLRETGRIFHLGISGSFRKPEANGYNQDGNHNPRKIEISADAGTTVDKTHFISTSIVDANHQTKFAAEFLFSRGLFLLQGEYFYNNINLGNSYNAIDVNHYAAQGTYGQIAFLALGKNYSYSADRANLNRPYPKSLEIVARFNHVNLNHKSSGIIGGEQNDISLAINYYLSNNLMFRLNYANVNASGKKEKENFTIIQGRIQVIF